MPVFIILLIAYFVVPIFVVPNISKHFIGQISDRIKSDWVCAVSWFFLVFIWMLVANRGHEVGSQSIDVSFWAFDLVCVAFAVLVIAAVSAWWVLKKGEVFKPMFVKFVSAGSIVVGVIGLVGLCMFLLYKYIFPIFPM